MGDNLETLYEKYNILSDAKDKISEHSKEFLDSIEGVKGSENEKMLTAQIISKFFKHFPQHQDLALNALLDLCEDDEVKIRACAMRYLVSICKDVKAHTCKVTDILAQMMQLDEQRDHTTAQWCLLQLWKDDALNVLKALYNHIHALSSSQPARQKCVDFVHRKLIKLADNPGDIEALVVEESKKILQDDVSSDELIQIIAFLKTTKYGRTAAGQQELLDFIADIMEIEGEFDPRQDADIDRVVICTMTALSLFSAKIESTRFAAYYCDQVLPQWDKVPASGGLRAQLLRHLAELSVHCGKFENPSLHVVQIFDKIKQYMPPPPEDADVNKMPNLEFSYVECLLFAFHRLARQCPDFLTHDANVLKDFRSRLVYFSRGVQGCNKVLAAKGVADFSKKEVEKAKIAPAVLSNINLLIKDLFYQPPMYKCKVLLSFKQSTSSNTETLKVKVSSSSATSPQKRHAPITFEGSGGTQNSKQQRGGRPGSDNVKIYTPPSGKFSNNFQNYDRAGSRNGRGGRGGRGGLRGRGGSGRVWRN